MVHGPVKAGSQAKLAIACIAMTTPSLPCPGTPSLPCHGAGDEAVHFIDSGQDADLMLLDITMPVKSGLEVMQDVGHHLPHYPIVRRVAQ